MATRFVSELAPALRELARFTRDIEENVNRFRPGALEAFRARIEDIGEREIRRLHVRLVRSHFGRERPPAIITALLERHMIRWRQVVRSAFATALDSVPETVNPNRARDRIRRPRTIETRLLAQLGLGSGEERPAEGRVLFGKIRATRRGPRRPIRIRLVPFLNMLARTAPVNLARDFVSLVVRLRAPEGADPLYLVTAGVGPHTCRTCRTLQGRVLTRAAVRIATTRLRPPLFHPNCRHALRTAVAGVSRDEYDPRKHGAILTVDALNALVRSGDLISGPEISAAVLL